MADITNSHSLTDFQRNAKSFIEGLNESRRPVLLTVNGKVEAVLVDPITYQHLEESAEREVLVAAIKEGERSLKEGRTRPAEEFFAELRAKYAL